jgi:hypothetical protein
MIIQENDYKPLKEIPKMNPNIVIYSSIFDSITISTLFILLQKIIYTNGFAFFSENKNVEYKNIPTELFPKFLQHIKKNIETLTSFHFNSCLINTDKTFINNLNQEITPRIIIGSDIKLKLDSKNILDIKDGSLIIERENIENNYIECKNNFYVLSFFYIPIPENNLIVKNKKTGILADSLLNIYLSYKQRILLKEKIKKELLPIHNIPEGEQCYNVEKLKKYLNVGKLIGSGDWGNVYSAYLNYFCSRYKFAIKMSRISETDLKEPYSESSPSWYEFWLLKDIIKPLIEKKICPNLPLYIDTFLCNKCDFKIREKKQSHPCIITITEFANSDFKTFLLDSKNIKDKIIYSALFQIMAGLHAIQMSGQILNNDIKSANILVYNVKPGGYWKYRIQNINYYVPNYGKMFVLNDFGVSQLYDPNFQLYSSKNTRVFNLGSRYAINMNEKFSPVQAKYEFIKDDLIETSDIIWENTIISKGATYSLDRKTGQIVMSKTKLSDIQKQYLFENGVNVNPNTWEYFENPYIIPPFEFYNDVQDVLRMFVGGKRTTQNGYHKIFTSISQDFKESVIPYLGKSENAKSKNFSTDTFHVLAGSFIKNFFSSNYNLGYTKKPNGKLIEFYNMDKNKKYE